jgi:hypothetical protein
MSLGIYASPSSLKRKLPPMASRDEQKEFPGLDIMNLCPKINRFLLPTHIMKSFPSLMNYAASLNFLG